MRLGWVVGAVLLAAAVLTDPSGSVTAASEDDEPSAAQLGDATGGESMWEMLSPEERAAVERSGIDWVQEDRSPADGEKPSEASDSTFGKKMDKAGKVGFSILAVSLSLAAAAAPFLLF